MNPLTIMIITCQKFNGQKEEGEAVKNKKYYEGAWEKFWDACWERAKNELEEEGADLSNTSDLATEIFEETANAEQVIGYYIHYHGDDALKDWLGNTNGLIFSERDEEIDSELKRLFV